MPSPLTVRRAVEASKWRRQQHGCLHLARLCDTGCIIRGRLRCDAGKR